VTAAADWVSLAGEELLVSLRAPRGWTLQAEQPDRLLLLAGTADESGYRTSLSVVRGEPEQPGTAWFEAFCDAAPGALAAALDGFELIGTDGYLLSSGAPVFVVRYRQQAEGAPATSHLQAYGWAGSTRMYLVDSATLREHEERDLPLFAATVASLRILPERP
jgi:hypothetical protein